MSTSSSSVLLQNLIRLSEPLKESLCRTPYTPPESYASVSVKSQLQSLLPNTPVSEPEVRIKVKNFALFCAALASSSNSTSMHLSWVPDSLSSSAVSAFEEFAQAYYAVFMHSKCLMKVGELELDFGGVVESEKKLVIELMPEVLPLLKSNIKESAIDASDEGDGISAASARAPVAYAILAAYQFRWFVTQVDAPYIGKLSHLLIPCALTALDHWSPEVKGQGMISFIYLAKNVKAEEIGGYADVILDACCQNIASDDEIWHYVVEMSVLLVTLTQQRNPRSSWYEKLLNEMLNHLERQPRNKQRRIAWLAHCEPLFSGLGLILLAHFRRLFPLFFKWMHADDDETVLLVLERMATVVKLTWMWNSLYIERSGLDMDMVGIKCPTWSHRSQFNAIWIKHKDDPNLTTLLPSLSEKEVRILVEHHLTKSYTQFYESSAELWYRFSKTLGAPDFGSRRIPISLE
ncbi:hypothetical protein Sango_2660900 [Sesamum angolense]|uniref:Uncharacterized protein n=1 Tax=Sesamum angolense TaxID=2727404 RepID=A0AAE2BH62_9LAMI|nr:hypothetical protein Sango_2660900 [Sesamum angolense]